MIWILKRREKAVAAALASALLGVPGVAMAQSQEPIKIGFSSELSGQYSFWGTSCTAGMKLAEKRINAAGGVLHRPLQFLVVDNYRAEDGVAHLSTVPFGAAAVAAPSMACNKRA